MLIDCGAALVAGSLLDQVREFSTRPLHTCIYTCVCVRFGPNATGRRRLCARIAVPVTCLQPRGGLPLPPSAATAGMPRRPLQTSPHSSPFPRRHGHVDHCFGIVSFDLGACRCRVVVSFATAAAASAPRTLQPLLVLVAARLPGLGALCRPRDQRRRRKAGPRLAWWPTKTSPRGSIGTSSLMVRCPPAAAARLHACPVPGNPACGSCCNKGHRAVCRWCLLGPHSTCVACGVAVWSGPCRVQQRHQHATVRHACAVSHGVPVP